MGVTKSARLRVVLTPGREFKGRDGRGPYRVPDPQAVIDRTIANREIVALDFSHGREHHPSAPLAGIITGFDIRADGGIVGDVRLTQAGLKAVQGKEYRYVSPVFRHIDGEVRAILRAGLVNVPNLDGTYIDLAELTEQHAGETMENQQLPADKLTGPERATCARFGIAPQDFVRAKLTKGHFTVDKSWIPAPRPTRLETMMK